MMQLNELIPKVGDDIGTILYRLRQGYFDHIAYGEQVLSAPMLTSPEEGERIRASIEEHRQYIKEVERFAVSIGFQFQDQKF